MIDKRKVRIMTSLAIYDKHYGKEDKKADEYYKGDYVYKINVVTRICVSMGLCILLFFRVMNIFLIDSISFTDINYKTEIIKFVVFSLVVIIFYTIVGGYISRKKYNASMKRLNSYHNLLDMLYDKEDNDNN